MVLEFMPLAISQNVNWSSNNPLAYSTDWQTRWTHYIWLNNVPGNEEHSKKEQGLKQGSSNCSGRVDILHLSCAENS